MYCFNHDWIEAKWRCRDCGRYFCPECIDTITVQHREIEICRMCRGKCEKLEEAVEKEEAELPFWAQFPLIYPLRGYGIVVIILAAVFLYLMNFAARFISFGPYGIIITVIFLVFAWGYISLFFLNIINSSAKGGKELPLMPDIDFQNPAGSVFSPLFLLAGTTILCIAPATAYYFFMNRQTDPLFWLLAVIGGLYLPMGLLAVAIFETIDALNPVPIIKSILRIPFQYVIACFFFYLCLLFIYLATTYLKLTIPFIGSILRLVIFLYFSATALHLLGLLYYKNKRKLRWA